MSRGREYPPAVLFWKLPKFARHRSLCIARVPVTSLAYFKSEVRALLFFVTYAKYKSVCQAFASVYYYVC